MYEVQFKVKPVQFLEPNVNSIFSDWLLVCIDADALNSKFKSEILIKFNYLFYQSTIQLSTSDEV